eukprot:CAMPEP_0178382914 /NCGR_PEP_ID=MMETSP0689_2-20121128/6735_1 /TAXON_ID=160604 /ORGANISM="Amphidinium massartii, Strain CS-259" /LENGTH=407 /DNA_ID=CAMNT_0020003125 /DNA_START=23 /DNA_END=1242 /DNA_ORIENTATION=-
MGYGTGVYNITYLNYFMRGALTGVIGASSLAISEQTGALQRYLVVSRGVGLILGPAAFAPLIGKSLWSGESMSLVSAWAAIRAVAQIMVPRLESHMALYACFCLVGVAMAVLDTQGLVLVTRVRGAEATVPLIVLAVTYSVGGMIAPFLVVSLGMRAWDLMAAVDFVIAISMAAKRFGRGKPKDWKLKGCRSPGSLSSTPVLQAVRQVPPRVFAVGLLLIFMVKTVETAMSSWGFSFGVTSLQLSPRHAAMLPSTHYFGATIMRLLLVPLSRCFVPSTLVQASGLVTILGGGLLYYHSLTMSAGTDELAQQEPQLGLVLSSAALVGIGCSPIFSLVVSAMRQHGELDARQQGIYVTFANLGNTTGLWLPGVIALPTVQFGCCAVLFLVLAASSRDFPWVRPNLTSQR